MEVAAGAEELDAAFRDEKTLHFRRLEQGDDARDVVRVIGASRRIDMWT